MTAAGWDKVTSDEAAEMHADVRAEVLAEAADAALAASVPDSAELSKRLHSYTDAWNAGNYATFQAVRDLIAKGKGTGDGTQPPAGEPTQPADFFQPLLTYVRQHHGEYVLFTVASVSAGPGHTYPTAFGWRQVAGEDWEPSTSDDMSGWSALADEPVHPVQPAQFFQPGHGYTHRKGTDFRCIAVTTHPNTGEARAFGWVVRSGWHSPAALDPDDWSYNYDGCEPPAGGGGADV